MDEQNRGWFIVAVGTAVLLLGTVVYGLVTGEIPTVGGRRYESELIWQSREQEPRLFWFAIVVHLAVSIAAGFLARHNWLGRD